VTYLVRLLFESGKRGEIVGGEHLPLDNREVDFDLIEPTGVDGSVDQDRIRPFVAKTLGCFLAPMSGTVVHNPEDIASGSVGFLAHAPPISLSNGAMLTCPRFLYQS
jgi:hypothetical protein